MIAQRSVALSHFRYAFSVVRSSSSAIGSHASEQFADRLSGRQPVRAVGLVVDLGGVIESEAPEDGGGQVARRNGIAGRVGAEPVAGTVHRPAAHASSGEQNAVAVRPVVAAALAVDLRRAA